MGHRITPEILKSLGEKETNIWNERRIRKRANNRKKEVETKKNVIQDREKLQKEKRQKLMT